MYCIVDFCYLDGGGNQEFCSAGSAWLGFFLYKSRLGMEMLTKNLRRKILVGILCRSLRTV